MNIMVRHWYYILFSLLLCSFKPPVKFNDWAQDQLKGKVKSIIRTKQDFDTTGSRKNPKNTDQTIKTYNEKGFLLEIEHHKKERLTYYRIKYLYNELNQITEWINYAYDSTIISRHIYLYNLSGLEIESKHYVHTDSLSSIWKTIYTNNENNSETIYYNSSGDIIQRETIKRKRKGKEFEKKKFMNDSILEYCRKSHYNRKGVLLGSKFYGSDGNLMNTEKSKYNKNNKLINLKVINRYSSTYNYSWQYDTNDNRIQMTHYNSISELRETTNYEYVYDSKGNWIKLSQISNGRITQIIERKIEYYKD